MTDYPWSAISAVGTILFGIAALGGGFWAYFNYRKTRRFEAAKWLYGLFREFYVEDTFNGIRVLFEYHYPDILGPLIERRITDRQISVSDDEERILTELDTFLNYFEHVLYLEEEEHLKENDRQTIFKYWFKLLNDPSRGGLRRYVACFGFTRIARSLDYTQDDKDYIALYESPTRGLVEVGKIVPADKLEYQAPCKIPGSIYDFGEYLGLVLDANSEVEGKLYEIKDNDFTLFRKLDSFKKYDPNNRKTSLYIRCCIRLADPEKDAWVYVFNQDIPNNS